MTIEKQSISSLDNLKIKVQCLRNKIKGTSFPLVTQKCFNKVKHHLDLTHSICETRVILVRHDLVLVIEGEIQINQIMFWENSLNCVLLSLKKSF